MIGRNQGRALMVLVAMHPRPVDARWLAHVIDSAGDLTHGRRAIAVLARRRFIALAPRHANTPKGAPVKWAITREGQVAWMEWLPSFVDRNLGEESIQP